MAKGKTKFPFDTVSGTVQGNDRTIGRNKGFTATFSRLKTRKR